MIRDAVTSSRAALAAGATLALTAAAPAVAAAPSGGAPLPTTAAGAAAPTPKLRPRIHVTSSRAVGVVGRRAVYAGRVADAPRGLRVRLELRRRGAWRAVARDVVSAKGRFRITKQIAGLGDSAARLRVVGRAGLDGTHRRVPRVHGFRRAVASYFGPGLYGSALACGGHLSPGTMGVANKTLPCGTTLTLRVGNRQVTTKVVDRGPYVAGREFDLTAATRARLGFGSTGTVLVDR